MKLNKYSGRITEPKSQGASQAMLLGVGLSEEDLSKPQVGISSVWYEGNTCNMHLLKLSEAVKEGVRQVGLVLSGSTPLVSVMVSPWGPEACRLAFNPETSLLIVLRL